MHEEQRIQVKRDTVAMFKGAFGGSQSFFD
jgi:hypothetical protein